MEGRPPLFESAEVLATKGAEYFEKCKRENKRPTITGLAYDLGFESRQSLYDYEKKDEFSYIVKRLRLFVESGYEEALSSGNCTGAIFALKNMGWKDKTETGFTDTEGKDVSPVTFYIPDNGRNKTTEGVSGESSL